MEPKHTGGSPLDLPPEQLRDQFASLSSWRGLQPCLFSWLMIAIAISLSIYLSHAAPLYFLLLLPFTLLLIANRIFTLFLLSHEAVHTLLTPSRRLNDWIGRYFCAFPVGVSLSRWRTKHLLHHRFLGTDLDLDRPIYSELYHSFSTYVGTFLSGKVTFTLLSYFTPFDFVLSVLKIETPLAKIKRGLAQKNSSVFAFDEDDSIRLILFQVTAIAFLFTAGWGMHFALYWLVPHLLVQFYFPIWSHIQHGEAFRDADFNRRSRTVTSPRWLMPVLMPLNVRFHLEHHLYPSVPQYKLKDASKRLVFQPQFADRYVGLREALQDQSGVSR